MPVRRGGLLRASHGGVFVSEGARSGRARATAKHEDVEARIRRVVEYISLFGWLPTSCAKLADELGVSEDAVHDYRQTAERRIREHRASAVEPSREDFLEQLNGHIVRFADDARALPSLLALKARVSGLEQAPSGQGDGVTVTIRAADCAPPADDE